MLVSDDAVCGKKNQGSPKIMSSIRLYCNIQHSLMLKKEVSNLKDICKNELHKACFSHDAAYFDSKDFAKRTISDKK